MALILINSSIPNLQLKIEKKLQESAPDLVRRYEFETVTSENAFAERLQVAKIVLGDPKRILAVKHTQSTSLKWVQSTWAGVDALVRMDDHGNENIHDSFPFTLTRLGGCFGSSMAEYCFAHILQRERKLIELRKSQDQQLWKPVEYRTLRSSVIGIIGFGEIGSEVARVASLGFGMRVIFLRRRNVVEQNCPYIIYPREQIKEFLSKVDFLVSILPSTTETRNMLSGDVLSHCKKDCFFINVGRGDVIDEESLVNSLKSGWISGAVLDVFNEEPLSQSSKLWKMENVTITPHIAALSFAEDVANVFIENLIRFSNYNPLRYVVDPNREY